MNFQVDAEAGAGAAIDDRRTPIAEHRNLLNSTLSQKSLPASLRRGSAHGFGVGTGTGTGAT